MMRRAQFQSQALKLRAKRKSRFRMAPLQYFQAAVFAALVFFLVCAGLAALDIRRTSQSVRADYHSTTVAANSLVTRADFYLFDKDRGTWPLINANLIHSDLVLGDMQRVSALQEGYWLEFSKSSLTTVNKANDFLDSLKTTSDGVKSDADRIADAFTDKGSTFNQQLVRVGDSFSKAGVTLDNFDRILANKRIPEMIDDWADTSHEVAGMAKHGNKIMGNIDQKIDTTLHPGFWGKVRGGLFLGAEGAVRAAQLYYYLH